MNSALAKDGILNTQEKSSKVAFGVVGGILFLLGTLIAFSLYSTQVEQWYLALTMNAIGAWLFCRAIFV